MECLREVERIELEVERTECDAAQPLTTISPDNYVVIDDQAAQVLKAQSQRGRLYEIYYATKSLILSPPEVSLSDKGYDTSSWKDVDETGERDQDYIEATHAAEYVRSGISSKFSGISGYKYKVNKFKIVESKDKNSALVRDYFLKILIGAPNLNYIFAQVHETEKKKLTLVTSYLKSSPQ